jgi:SAM-dependent methyltransferase
VRWNHNIHYQRLVVRRLTAGTCRALDVGCGEGALARELSAAGVPTVVGIDRDVEQIRLAHEHDGGPEYVVGDFLSHDFDEPFDLVAAVAAVHHVELRAGLRRLRELVRPGGRVVVIGMARRSWPADLPWDAAGFALHRYHRMRRGHWQHSAPIVDPPLTTAQSRRVVAEELPGTRFRRLAMFRHLIVWDAP